MLLQADGTTFVLRDGEFCHYAAEDAISPLWKDRRFPVSGCISGWCMERDEAVAIADIREDPRIAQDVYLGTFVKSLAMAPVRRESPMAAIGAYWSEPGRATDEQLARLQMLGNAASLALAALGGEQRDENKESASLNAILAHVPDGITIATAPDVAIERISAHGLKIIHRAENELAGMKADKHPDAWQVFCRDGVRRLAADELPLTRATKRGEVIENEQLTLKLPDGRLLPILCNAGPVRDAQGCITGGIIVWRDITERVKAEAAQRLIMRELDHRVKNIFTIFTAIIGLTARHTTCVREMADALIGRVGALSRAHEMIRSAISPGDLPEDIPLHKLLAALVTPHTGADGQFLMSGPEVRLGSSVAVNLALIVHELATNAAKYGALSNETGRVDVTWREEHGRIRLSWRESDGPPLPPEPRRSGFGGELIQRTLKALGGSVTYSWDPAGLRIELAVPYA